MTQSKNLDTLLADCIAEARAQGWTGADSDYVHTAEDLEWVTDELGYLPSRSEWAAAGLPHIGGSHVGMPRLPQEWVTACRANEGDETLEDWIGSVTNAETVEIDDAGSVWIEGPMAGHWLDQGKLDDVMQRIDAGV